jgi:hypothetical protein
MPVCVTLLAITFTLHCLSTRHSFYVCYVPILLATLQCLLEISQRKSMGHIVCQPHARSLQNRTKRKKRI